MRPTLAIIGTGRLGEAIAASVVGRGWTEADRVICSDVDTVRVAEVSARLGVRAAADAHEAVEGAELILVAVKPHDMRALLEAVGPAVTSSHTLVSVAAGITTAFMESLLPQGTAVVRVMPNTPILVGEAMSALAAGRHAGPDRMELAEGLFAQVGRTLRVSETAMDAVTAVSGSGPAYVFLLAESMTAAAETAGLSPEHARELVVQTVLGAGRLLREDGRDAAELRAMVTSPKGTTEAALEVLEARDVRGAMRDAVAAAKRRSEELASG